MLVILFRLSCFLGVVFFLWLLAALILSQPPFNELPPPLRFPASIALVVAYFTWAIWKTRREDEEAEGDKEEEAAEANNTEQTLVISISVEPPPTSRSLNT